MEIIAFMFVLGFVGSVAGWLLDKAPGVFFLLLAVGLGIWVLL